MVKRLHVAALFLGCSLTLLITSAASAEPIGWSVRAHTGDRLYRIDLSTGRATDYGDVAFGYAEGLALVGDQLFAIDGVNDELWNITPTGPASWPPVSVGVKVGDTGPRFGEDAGLAETPSGQLYNVQGSLAGESSLYTVDTLTGAATFIGGSSVYADGLAINAAGVSFAVDGVFTDYLYRVDLLSGAFTPVGSLGLGNTIFHTGLDFDSDGRLWMITTGVSAAPSQIYQLDTATGAATFIANVTVNIDGVDYGVNGFQGLAIGDAGGRQTTAVMPEPGTLFLIGSGFAWVAHKRRQNGRRLKSATL